MKAPEDALFNRMIYWNKYLCVMVWIALICAADNEAYILSSSLHKGTN